MEITSWENLSLMALLQHLKILLRSKYALRWRVGEDEEIEVIPSAPVDANEEEGHGKLEMVPP